MSKPRFTPGPWTKGRLLMTKSVRERWTQDMRDKCDEQERRLVFSNFTADDEGRSRTLIAECRNEEDAHLIAAAPELYEALELLLSYGDIYSCKVGQESPYQIALSALQKARGES